MFRHLQLRRPPASSFASRSKGRRNLMSGYFRPHIERLEPRRMLVTTPVTFTITRVIEHEDPDPFPFQGDGDYYSIVDINNLGAQTSGIVTGEDFNPNWSFTRNVELADSPVEIEVTIKDEDDDADDFIDINPTDNVVAILLFVDLFTGEWSGTVDFPTNTSTGDGDFEEPFEGGEKGQIFFDIAVPELTGPDSDGDGLLDSWESQGLDINNDGTVDLDLPALGADPNHKDLFVEVDGITGLGPAALPGITDVSNATPVVITSPSHGVTTGTRIKVQSVTGNTAANGTFTATRIDSDEFQLDGSSGNGAYAGGGVWSLADLEGTGLATGTVLDLVIDSFYNAAVNNPDGQPGINLHTQIDETNLPLQTWDSDLDGDGLSPYGEDTNANQMLDCGLDGMCGTGDMGDEDLDNDGVLDDGDADDQGGYPFYVELKQARFGTAGQRGSSNVDNIMVAKRLVYRYGVFASFRVDGLDPGRGVSIGSSGIAWSGSDFAVTMGTWNVAGGTPDQQAGTFMHELGHTIGLGHGGDSGVNYKPNYHSNMSYSWQLPNSNYPESWSLDFSEGTFPALDENNLNESNGIGGHAGDRVQVGPVAAGPPMVNAQIVNESGSVDWSRDDADSDGNVANDTGVVADINHVRLADDPSPGEVLTDFDDWDNIVYAIGEDGLTDGATPDFEPDELTFEVFQSLTGILFYAAPTGNGSDDLTLRRNGDHLEIVDNNTGAIVARQFAQEIHTVEVVGSASESDTLRVDFGGGNPVPENGVSFDGGEAAGIDTLALEGALPAAATYTPDATNPEGGSVDVGGSVITFQGLEFVRPVAPEVTGVRVSAAEVDESGSITITGQFLDPGSLSTHAVAVDWGDGLSDPPVGLAAGARAFSVTHVYLDDNPTGTPFDINQIVVTVMDDDGLSGTGTASIQVNNLPPVITDVTSSSPSSDKAAEGDVITFTGSFTDPGVLDTHTAEVDWGDGNVLPATVMEVGGVGTFTAQHSYQFGGIYTVQITLRDDDTGEDSATKAVFVTGVGVHEINGQQVLQVIGSNDEDQVKISGWRHGSLRVHTNFLPERQRVIDGTGIDLIQVVLCSGDDHATIAGNVNLPVVMDGGSGDDHLNGGKVASIVIGGEGDDTLLGGTARDLLIGGLGADRLVGQRGEDILISGTTLYDSGPDDDKLTNDFALLTLLDEWTSNRSQAERQTNIRDSLGPVLGGTGLQLRRGVSVFADPDEDTLTGGPGIDWYFADLDDVLTGNTNGESVD